MMSKVRLLFVLLMAVVLMGCTYKVSHPQSFIAVYVGGAKDRTRLLQSVAAFARLKNFEAITVAGNERDLESRGMFLHTFKSDNGSYITLTNISEGKCFDIAIFSKDGSASAEFLNQELSVVLMSERFADQRKGQCAGASATN